MKKDSDSVQVIQMKDKKIGSLTVVKTEESECDCTSAVEIFNFYADYETSSDPLKVKALQINGNDVRDSIYRYANVEHILFTGLNSSFGNGLKYLDRFEKLKGVYFEGGKVEIDTSAEWIRKIEILYAGKIQLKGGLRFRHFKNLKVLMMGYSGFEQFPGSLEDLKCLQDLRIAYYRFGPSLKLEDVDLRKFVCLKNVELDFAGADPKGLLDSNSCVKVALNPVMLDKKKLAAYKAYRKRQRNCK